jgi:hypothetical protein
VPTLSLRSNDLETRLLHLDLNTFSGCIRPYFLLDSMHTEPLRHRSPPHGNHRHPASPPPPLLTHHGAVHQLPSQVYLENGAAACCPHRMQPQLKLFLPRRLRDRWRNLLFQSWLLVSMSHIADQTNTNNITDWSNNRQRIWAFQPCLFPPSTQNQVRKRQNPVLLMIVPELIPTHPGV